MGVCTLVAFCGCSSAKSCRITKHGADYCCILCTEEGYWCSSMRAQLPFDRASATTVDRAFGGALQNVTCTRTDTSPPIDPEMETQLCNLHLTFDLGFATNKSVCTVSKTHKNKTSSTIHTEGVERRTVQTSIDRTQQALCV